MGFNPPPLKATQKQKHYFAIKLESDLINGPYNIPNVFANVIIT